MSFNIPVSNLPDGVIQYSLAGTNRAGIDADVGNIFTEKFPIQSTSDFLKPFLMSLDGLIQEILNPDIPFMDEDLREHQN